MNWQQLTALSLGEVVAWAEDQPWAQAMARCQQDATWHAEGDVWTHTKLVCAQLPLLTEWPALTQREQTLLIFTALFHDSAKPLTSQLDETTGHIRSPKHAVKGEHLVRDERPRRPGNGPARGNASPIPTSVRRNELPRPTI